TSSTHGTHPIDRPGACSRHDPGFGRAPGGIVRAGRPPGFPEDVLQDVGGVAAVTDDAKDQRIDHGGVAVVEPGERVAVARYHSPTGMAWWRCARVIIWSLPPTACIASSGRTRRGRRSGSRSTTTDRGRGTPATRTFARARRASVLRARERAHPRRR